MGGVKRLLCLGLVWAGAAVLAGLLIAVADVGGRSVGTADGDGHGVLCVCVQGSEPRIVGESAACGSQVVDEFGGLRGTGELAGLPQMVLGVLVAGEQDPQRSQV